MTHCTLRTCIGVVRVLQLRFCEKVCCNLLSHAYVLDVLRWAARRHLRVRRTYAVSSTIAQISNLLGESVRHTYRLKAIALSFTRMRQLIAESTGDHCDDLYRHDHLYIPCRQDLDGNFHNVLSRQCILQIWRAKFNFLLYWVSGLNEKFCILFSQCVASVSNWAKFMPAGLYQAMQEHYGNTYQSLLKTHKI